VETKAHMLAELAQIAPLMESLRPSPRARVHYHMLADALYWSDEFPESGLPWAVENYMRMVLRYRTTLLLGSPDPKWKPYWEEATKQFPKWIGFEHERTTESEEWKRIFLQLRGPTGRGA
jgi:hypothetical protein